MSKKISQLSETTSVQPNDFLAVVSGGVTKKVTKANLLKEIAEFADGEIPAGLIDGSNAVFTTASNFISGSLHIYLNGLRLPSSAYMETGADKITFTEPPETGDSIIIDYRK